jgi:hypothetical protein
MTTVLALDLATTSGWALGIPGGDPRCGSVRFGRSGDSEDDVFEAALRWALKFFAVELNSEDEPLVVLERLLPPQARPGTTSRAVRDRLAGLHGIIRAAARHNGIRDIRTATVNDVRNHFIQMSGAKRAAAKLQVRHQCELLGWRVNDDNAADAAALWSYQCALLNPMTGLRVSPLFRKKFLTGNAESGSDER